MSSPEVEENLLIFLHINEIVFVPLMQLVCLLPVVGFLLLVMEPTNVVSSETVSMWSML